MTKKKRLPRVTKPITAYQLLSRVCAVILAEPKRYNQGTWDEHLDDELAYYGDAADEREIRRSFPSCGTVCCVGGWIETLVLGTQPGDEAHKILGLEAWETVELFDATALQQIKNKVPREGTVAYARLGVRHIKAFQRSNAARLKSKIVTPVT